MGRYPEHDKMADVRDRSQAIGEFLDWLNEQGIHRAVYEDRGYLGGPVLAISTERIDTLLARYFGIDLNVIESEKRAMLTTLATGRED